VRGLTPAAKLVLILAANAADMDGRVFDVSRLQDRANLGDQAFSEALSELTGLGWACISVGVHPRGGDRRRCVQLYTSDIIQ
jgi:hypothetical protein